MKIATVKKQPREKRSWAISYKDALDTSDEIINVTSSVEIEGSTDVADLNVSVFNSTPQVRITADGGTDGVKYKITILVTTTNTNEIFEDELYVQVKEI